MWQSVGDWNSPVNLSHTKKFVSMCSCLWGTQPLRVNSKSSVADVIPAPECTLILQHPKTAVHIPLLDASRQIISALACQKIASEACSATWARIHHFRSSLHDHQCSRIFCWLCFRYGSTRCSAHLSWFQQNTRCSVAPVARCPGRDHGTSLCLAAQQHDGRWSMSDKCWAAGANNTELLCVLQDGPPPSALGSTP